MAQLKVVKSDIPYAGSNRTVFGVFDTINHRPHLAATAFLLRKTLNGARPNTLRTYAYSLANFLMTIEEDPDIGNWDGVGDEILHAYFEHILVGEKNLSGKSLELTRTVIIDFYNWANAYGWSPKKRTLSWGSVESIQNRIKIDLARDNSIDRFKLFTQYIPENEFNELLAWVPTKSEFEKQRDMICLKLGYLSGWRRSEIVDPKNIAVTRFRKAINDANQKNQLGFNLNIIGKGRGAGKVRQVYIPQRLREDIEGFIDGAHHKHGHSRLLICKRSGDPLGMHHTTYLFDHARKALICGQVPDSLNAWMRSTARCFHSLRHSYATNMARYLIENDLPLTILQELMGHTDIETTYAYVHFLDALQERTEAHSPRECFTVV
ncbi:tyrosine-type recombinase/integrase [Pseudomonas sp. TH49]|uniref:tyrosine-type recombinase/integrase n=1 Tax=Pseudomonas sp. TH49 TaxID=2796413 RepID=UPI0019115E28|nr:tyrosine-type recombinase/integrase [Pseudomonas sp. TH49]MBK5344622.1 tyrosine-type recombinase/integrase [Pseudomonas sp. TH49]